MSLVSDIANTSLALGSIRGRDAEAQAQIRAQQLAAQAQIRAQAGQQQLATIGSLAGTLAQIPQQMQAQQAARQESQLRGLQIQQAQQQLQAGQAAGEGQAAANQIIASLPRSADGTYDTGALLQRLAAANVPVKAQEDLAKSVDGVNKVIQSFNAARADHAADLADMLLGMHGASDPVTADTVHLGLAAAQAAGLASSKEVEQLGAALDQGGDPKALLQAIRKAGSKFQDKPVALAKDTTLVNPSTGEVIATGERTPKADFTIGNQRFSGETNQPIATGEPTPKSLQAERVLLDGKPAMVTFDPGKGVYLSGGVDVSARVKPIPPAAQSGNAAGEPLGGMTADTVEDTAARYRLVGERALPTRLDNAQKTAIMNAASRQRRELGRSPAQELQQQSAIKADQGALSKMVSMKSSAEAFESKALGEVPIIEALSKKVGRTSWPIINAALQAGKTTITGDSDATQLANAITSFTEEYAKIMTGTTGSAAAASDSARKASKDLINAAMNKGTMHDVLMLMQRQMGLTMQGYDATIGHINDRISASGPGGSVTPAPDGNQAPPPGARIRTLGPDGKIQ